MVVELVGLTAAAIATAAAIRRSKGSSERYGLPIALAALKLPTGAITAFLGLLLMRGQFVPGLTALDTSAQILAWALVFGYAQQLFTRLVDQQGQTVLDNVRGADPASAQSYAISSHDPRSQQKRRLGSPDRVIPWTTVSAWAYSSAGGLQLLWWSQARISLAMRR